MRNISNLNPLRHVRGRSLWTSAVIIIAILGSLAVSEGLAKARRGDARNVIFVSIPDGACWQDFAYLAAVPAAMKCNNGTPALIALDESCKVGPEVDDFLRRYKPASVYCLGAPTTPATTQPAGPAGAWMSVAGESADSAAWSLATTFWKTARTAVVCSDDNYAMALTASSVAGRLRVPMLYSKATGMTRANMSCLRYLGVRRVVVIGPANKAVADIKQAGLKVTELRNIPAVLKWMHQKKLPMTYLAVTNPDDRDKLVIRKLSLTAPLLAAARNGVAVGLAYKTIWKVAFKGTDCKDDAPKGTPASKKTPRKGKLIVDGKKIAYVATSQNSVKDYTQANIDFNGNGKFDDAGEGPFRPGSVVKLNGRNCSISMGVRNGMGKAEIGITSPCADDILADLKGLYGAMGGAPKHLCIVGMPDGIPQAIVPERAGEGACRDICSDFPFTNTDDDMFGEVALGRVTAESVTFSTLYASRVITYPKLLDASWATKVGQARWENAYGELFENVGFTVAPHHDVDKLKWIVKPAGKSRGKRTRNIAHNSPLTSVAAIVHTDHSWWREIGKTYNWDSDVLLAPVLVESGGCLTTALDRQPDFHSVVTRMLRNGAVGFVGNCLPATAFQEQQRMVFWNEVLAGRTSGQAQLEASNWAVEVVQETGQQNGGPNHYMLYLCGLFGDPGFTMHIPTEPQSAPARVESKGDVVSVYAPAQWWPCRIRVPEDWKLWTDKDLYVIRGAGTFPNRHWVDDGYDAEETYVGAVLRTDRKVASIKQVQSPKKPLGWTGKFIVDKNVDGTSTYRWRVRLVDFDQKTGKIISKVDRLDYKITFEDSLVSKP